ncbi:MAG: hypothetical protein Q9183_004658 [Haloplaca sp. 2 TL-2023]
MDAHHIYECTSVPPVDEVVLTINGKAHLIKSPDQIISVKATLNGSPDDTDILTRLVHLNEEAPIPTYPEEGIDTILALNREIQDILDDALRTTMAKLQATHDVDASTFLLDGATQDDMQAFQEAIEDIQEGMWQETHLMIVDQDRRVRQQLLQNDDLANEELQSSSTPPSSLVPSQTTSPRQRHSTTPLLLRVDLLERGLPYWDYAPNGDFTSPDIFLHILEHEPRRLRSALAKQLGLKRAEWLVVAHRDIDDPDYFSRLDELERECDMMKEDYGGEREVLKEVAEVAKGYLIELGMSTMGI